MPVKWRAGLGTLLLCGGSLELFLGAIWTPNSYLWIAGVLLVGGIVLVIGAFRAVAREVSGIRRTYEARLRDSVRDEKKE